MSLLADLLFKENTPLSEEELNRRVHVIVDTLEKLLAFTPDWQSEVDALRSVGLTRINDALLPAYDAILGLAQLGALFTASSASEVVVGTGERLFAIAADKRIVFAPAANLAISLEDDPTIVMYGRLASYDRESGVLAVTVDQAMGAGSHSGWTISASPPRLLMHELRTDNPHAVTAAQVGTLTVEQIDEDLDFLRASIEGGASNTMDTLGKVEVALGKRLRVDGAQGFSPAEMGQALANLGAGVLSGFRNKIINGNFDVWQHGVSQTLHGYGSDDLWQNNHIGSTKTHSRQSFELGQAAVPGNPKYYSRTAVVSVAGASNWVSKVQKIEGVETLAGQKATLTFYARANHAGDKLSVEFAQIFGTGGSPSASVTGLGVKKVTLGTEFQRYDAIVDLPSISGKTLGSNGNDRLEVIFWFDAGSDFDARTGGIGRQSGTFDIACVSLVKGDASKDSYPFSARHIAQETALCERYSLVIDHTDGASAPIAFGYNHNATSARLTIPVATRLRLVPTFSLLAGNFVLISAGSVLSGLDASKVTVVRATSKGVDIIVDITGAGFAGGQPVIMQQSGVKILLDARL